MTSTADPGDGSCDASCSLHDAIAFLDDGDTDADQINIQFNNAVNNVITLAAQLPTIDEPLKITSVGVYQPTISGNSSVPCFHVSAVFGPTTSVTLDKLLIGGCLDGTGGGGAVTNANSALTISNSWLFDNQTTCSPCSGGAVDVLQGSLAVTNSTFSGNHTSGTNSGGGAIWSERTLSITNSTISGNYTTGSPALGGGVRFSTIVDPLMSSVLTIENSTIAGNHTDGAGSHGGGVVIWGGNMGAATIRNTTVAGNTAAGNGGGVYSTASSPEPAIRSTIIADNVSSAGGPELASPDDVFGLGFSLVESSAGSPFSVTAPNVLGSDPQLGALDFHGGATRNQLPGATSPALDQGIVGTLGTDQRGGANARTLDIGFLANAAGGDGTDIGAIELQSSEAPSPPATGGGSPTTPALPQKKCKKKRNKGKTAAAAKKRKCRRKN